jgi:hypothetical protein
LHKGDHDGTKKHEEHEKDDSLNAELAKHAEAVRATCGRQRRPLDARFRFEARVPSDLRD